MHYGQESTILKDVLTIQNQEIASVGVPRVWLALYSMGTTLCGFSRYSVEIVWQQMATWWAFYW